MRQYWRIVALAAVVPIAGCGGKAESDATAEGVVGPVAVEVAKAVQRPMETTVVAQGTLMAGQGRSSRVAPIVAGRVAAVFVREGDRVTAGQVVATLDGRFATAQAAQARYSARAADVDQANAVRAASLALNSARIDREAAIQQALTAQQSAETDLAKTRAGARPQEIAQAEQAVRQTQATRDRAVTEVERVRFLNEKGVTPKRQLDDAQTSLSVAESGLESAKAQASLVRAGSRPEDVRAAELRAQAARETLAQARKGGDAHVRLAEAALKQAKQGTLQVAAKRQEAISMQTAADYTTLRSPIAGVVTRRTVNPGDMADPATAAIEVVNTTSLDLLANVPADEGTSVRPGMIAHVKAAGGTVDGRVLSVGQVDPQTNLLPIRIVLDNGGGALKAGAFATAAIVLRTDRRAVVVPKQAVLSREGKSVVFTVGADDAAHEKSVKLGSEHDEMVEIVQGLKVGETVIRLGQYELSDGAKVKPAGTKAP